MVSISRINESFFKYKFRFYDIYRQVIKLYVINYVIYLTDNGAKVKVCPDIIILDQCNAMERKNQSCTTNCKAKHPGKYLNAYCQSDITCLCVYAC